MKLVDSPQLPNLQTYSSIHPKAVFCRSCSQPMPEPRRLCPLVGLLWRVLLALGLPISSLMAETPLDLQSAAPSVQSAFCPLSLSKRQTSPAVWRPYLPTPPSHLCLSRCFSSVNLFKSNSVLARLLEDPNWHIPRGWSHTAVIPVGQMQTPNSFLSKWQTDGQHGSFKVGYKLKPQEANASTFPGGDNSLHGWRL